MAVHGIATDYGVDLRWIRNITWLFPPPHRYLCHKFVVFSPHNDSILTIIRTKQVVGVIWQQAASPPHMHARYWFPILYDGPPLPPQIVPFHGDLDPDLIHDSLGTPESSTNRPSLLVQPFLQGSRLWQTSRQTDRQTTLCSVCNNRPHLWVRTSYCDAA